MVLRLFVSIRFQVLFHSPRRGSFHLSLTVLVLYRLTNVFSLGEWPPQLPTGFHVSRRTQVPDCICCGFAYGAVTLFGYPSQKYSATTLFAFCQALQPRCLNNGLGWSPFARHYSGNILFSSGYLDVSVPPVPSSTLCVQVNVPRHDSWWVSPFGYPRILRLHTAPRGFSQCTTSFFGICHLGIHRMPLVAYGLIRRS